VRFSRYHSPESCTQSESASRVAKLRQRSSAETPLAEEPDARIAHVRICGGPGWATAGPTWPAASWEILCACELRGKIFPPGRVRIAWNARLSSRAEISKNAGTPDFIEPLALTLLMKLSGAVLAINRVGQRDTRWLTPLTVSGGYQGEEGGRQISGACSYPTAASAFSLWGAVTRVPQTPNRVVLTRPQRFMPRHNHNSPPSPTPSRGWIYPDLTVL
jgi:hypothetical protein